MRDLLLPCLLLVSVACAPRDSSSAPESEATTASLSPAQAWRRQVLYLVMPDRFANGDPGNDDLGAPDCHDPTDPQRYHGGDFEGLRQRLPYLKELGATAIWITPAYEQIGRQTDGRCGYHGYWADAVEADGQAVEPKLGTSQDLRRLVDASHAEGLRFMLDLVVNHTGDTARLPRQRPEWFHDPVDCAGRGNALENCPLDQHPDFAHEREDVAEYLDRQSIAWTEQYRLDGIRMDTAMYVPTSYFRDHWFPAVRSVRPDLFAVGEVFYEGEATRFTPYLGAGFDSVFNFPLRRALVNALARGGSVDAIANVIEEQVRALGAEATLSLVTMLDNHDVPRFVNEPGPGVSEEEIRQRYRLALAALFTLPGIPQLYYGDELGLYGGNDPDNRRDMPAWAFTAEGRAGEHAHQALPDSQGLFGWVQSLIAIRRTSSALSDGSFRELWRQNGGGNPNVLSFARRSADELVVVVLNADAKPLTDLEIPTPELEEGRVLDDLLGGPPVIAGPRALTVSLPPRSAALYRVRPGGAEVTFEVSASGQAGERRAIAGSTPELGAWNPAQSVPLHLEGCEASRCRWRATVRGLEEGRRFEFKVVRLEGANTEWEPGANRVATAGQALEPIFLP